MSGCQIGLDGEEAFRRLALGGMRGSPSEAFDLFCIAAAKIAGHIVAYLRRLRVCESNLRDCRQEVLLRVWGKRGTYKGCNEKTLYGWIRSICNHEATRLPPRKPRSDPDGEPWNPPAPGPSPETTVQDMELFEHLHACIDKLPGEQRQVVELIYFGGLDQRQVARIMDCSQAQVYKLKEKALEQSLEWMTGLGY